MTLCLAYIAGAYALARRVIEADSVAASKRVVAVEFVMHVKRTPLKLRTRADAAVADQEPAKVVAQTGRHEKATPKQAEIQRLARVRRYMETFPGIQDVDLLLLKGHVLIESELKRYLAFRLGLSDEDAVKLEERTKRMGFHHLANIALAGDSNNHLLALVSKLNDARTELAHGMDPALYEKKLNDLNDAVWGGAKKTPADRRFATTVALANIWGQVVRPYLDGRFGDGTFEQIMP